MFVLGVASMVLGLFLSSLVDTSDKAMPLLVVVVMFQVVLSGGIFPLHGKVGLEEVSWFSPSRWGYAATAATTNLNHILPPTAAAGPPAPVRPGRAAIVTGLPGAGPATVAKVYPVKHHPKASPSPSVSPGGRARAVGGAATTASDPLWDHNARTWLTDIALLLALALGFALLTWWRLVRMGPVKRR
jgi:ABC-2 type transporter